MEVYSYDVYSRIEASSCAALSRIEETTYNRILMIEESSYGEYSRIDKTSWCIWLLIGIGAISQFGIKSIPLLWLYMIDVFSCHTYIYVACLVMNVQIFTLDYGLWNLLLPKISTSPRFVIEI